MWSLFIHKLYSTKDSHLSSDRVKTPTPFPHPKRYFLEDMEVLEEFLLEFSGIVPGIASPFQGVNTLQQVKQNFSAGLRINLKPSRLDKNERPLISGEKKKGGYDSQLQLLGS